MKKILVTGAAGFIGSNVSKKLAEKNLVIGIDNFNDYNDINLKKNRLLGIDSENFIFYESDITNKEDLNRLFLVYKPDIVINLAAVAGVRNSIINPDTYIDFNINGFYNILEACKNHNIDHLIFASSSSVYGNSKDVPFKEDSNTDFPVSLYASTKKCNEILAYSYSKMYNMNITGLRFFTVYGPAGRPDMAYFKFTNKLVNNENIDIYNNGDLRRDFTYIDDIVEGITRVVENEPKDNYNIYNIGKGEPVILMDFVNILVQELINNNLLSKDFDINSKINYRSMQNGDVYETFCDTSKFQKDFNYTPKISLKIGLNNFARWYKEYYKK